MPSTPKPRPNVAQMTPYVPGEQPGPHEQVIKLNTNENPFPPSPRVLEAIRTVSAETLRRYPAPKSDAFRATAARVHGVPTDMVIAGNGSDEILAIVMRTFLGPGEVLAYPDPTYSLYPVLADAGESRVCRVAWGPGWQLPTSALLATAAASHILRQPQCAYRDSGREVRGTRARPCLRRAGAGRRSLRRLRR